MHTAIWVIVGAGGTAAIMAAFIMFTGSFNLFMAEKPSTISDSLPSNTNTNTGTQAEGQPQASQPSFITSNDFENQFLQQELQRQKEESALQSQAYEKELRRQEYEKFVQLSDTNPLVRGLISGQLNFYIQPVPSYAAQGVKEQVEKVADSLDGHSYLGIPFQSLR